MNLSSVGILATYRCTIACRHCYINCSPEREEVLGLDLAERLLGQVKELGLPGSSIHFGGGEPCLYFDHLVEILKLGQRLDMSPVSWVETNCSWCTSDQIARDRLGTLKENGVGKLWLSTDPYHQEFVPFENVARAYRIGVGVFGERGMTISRREYFDSPETWPDFESYAKDSPPMLMGRAYRCLSQFLPRKPLREFEGVRCEDQISPHQMREVHLNPDGTAMATNCSGVLIGDTIRNSLKQIFTEMDWRENEILRRLADRGPLGLLDMAPDFKPKETYASKCELCWEIRSAMAPQHPKTLHPPECYGFTKEGT